MASVKKFALARVSYWYFFRLIFVLFFIYLTGNLFYLWDGFTYYALSDFLQSVALVAVLWSILALLASVLLWILFSVIERLCLWPGWNIRLGHLLFFTAVFLFCGALLWKGKKLIWHDLQTTLQMKLIVLAFVTIVSGFFTWSFRNRIERWIDVIQKRVTPLVWLFGICIAVSVPVVVYQTWQEIQILGQGGASNQPLVTFIFDDEDESIYAKASPVFNAKGEVACIGMVSGYIGGNGHMTVAQLLELQRKGWEVVGHSKTHPDLTTLTETEIENELKVSKDDLNALGFKITNFSYPYHKHNAIVRRIARKHYRSARSGPEWTTGFNVNPDILRMYALSSFEIQSHDQISVLKKYVDDAEANNSWVIFTMHKEITSRITVLSSLIDYIRDRGIRIVTINQGLDLAGGKESRLGELLFILNNETPVSWNMLRRIHVLGQHLLSLFEKTIK